MIDINDIKPLEEVSRELRMLFALGALAVLFLFLGVWFSRKRRKKRGATLLTLTPAQEAGEKLYRLENMQLIKNKEVKKHYVLLSEIFRQYLERRFNFRAVERTSEEISDELASLQVPEPLRNQIRTILGTLDLVKFARATCTTDDARAETDRIRRFVLLTEQQNPPQREEEQVEQEEHVAV